MAVLALFGLVLASPSCAQSQTENTGAIEPPAFEVASIRPIGSDSFAPMVRINFEQDRYIASNCTLEMLLEEAYGVDNHQITRLPEWINSARFEIEARIDNATMDELSKMSGDQRKLAHQHMVQTLLADRFKLALHHETKEIPVYLLAIAKNGPKLREPKPGEAYTNGVKDPGGAPLGPHAMGNMSLAGHVELTGQGASLDQLVNGLREYLGRKIVDNTGLKGNYDFKLTFDIPWSRGGQTPLFDGEDGSRQESGNGSAPEVSVFTAFQEQLGLKLESRKGPVDVLVIDHVEKPSEN